MRLSTPRLPLSWTEFPTCSVPVAMLGYPFQKQILEPHSQRPPEERRRKVSLRVSTHISCLGDAPPATFYAVLTPASTPETICSLACSVLVKRRHTGSLVSVSATLSRGGLVIASADSLVRLGSLCLTRAPFGSSKSEYMEICVIACRLGQSPVVL